MPLSTVQKLTKRVIIGAVNEAVYGDGAVPNAASDYFEAYLEPNAIEYDLTELPRPHASVSLSPFKRVIGERFAKLSFSVPIKGSGAAGTAPKFGPILKSCLMSETVVPATSVTYKPATTSPASASILVYEDLVKHIFKGVVGTWKSVWAAGKLAMLNFELMGLYTEPAAEAFPTPTYDSIVPVAYLNTVNTVDALQFPFGTFNIDIGNKVAQRPSPNGAGGIAGFVVSDRDPRASFDPEEQAAGDYNWLNKITSLSELAVSLVLGATAGNICTLTMPKVQPVKRARSSRDGVGVETIDFGINRSTADDEISIAFT